MLKATTTVLAALSATAMLAGCIQEAPTQPLGPNGSGNVGNFPGGGGTGGMGGAGVGGGTGATGNLPNTESAAYEMFEAEIFPIYHDIQACTACHVNMEFGAPAIMGMTPETMYAALAARGLVTSPENSLLTTYGPHTGNWNTAGELALITQWLTLEAEEQSGGGGAGGSGGPGPTQQTLSQALDEFAKCMTLADWELYNMDNLHNVQVDTGERCKDCHSSGEAGAYLSENDLETYEAHMDTPYIYRLVTGTVNMNGSFNTLVSSQRYLKKGQECVGLDCHPEYELPNEIDPDGFVQATMNKLDAEGNCPLP